MANWCWNRVEFTGSEFALKGIELLFHEMAEKEKREDKGQLPDFITEDGDWFFQIQWEGGILYYETRWSPNTGVLVKIAEQYEVGFISSYEESGNLVYGEDTYENGKLTELCLDSADFDLYEFDEETERYTFEGQTYEGNEEILEILLERKKEAHTQIQ